MAERVEISVRLWCYQLAAQVDVRLAGTTQSSYMMENIALIIQAKRVDSAQAGDLCRE